MHGSARRRTPSSPGWTRSLTAVGERTKKVEARVNEAKLTAGEVQTRLTHLAGRQAGQALAERFEVAGKAARVTAGLEQADAWIDASAATVEAAQHALELAGKLGVDVKSDQLEGPLEVLAELQTKLQGAIETAEIIRGRAAGDDDGALKERLEQAARLALRIVATLGIVQSRLETLHERIDKTKVELPDVEARVIVWINLIAVGLTVLLLWMLAGQLALFHFGWTGLRRQRRQEPGSPL